MNYEIDQSQTGELLEESARILLQYTNDAIKKESEWLLQNYITKESRKKYLL